MKNKIYVGGIFNVLMVSILQLAFAASLVGCNPVWINDELNIPGDFSDPMYSKIFGKLSMDASLEIDPEYQGQISAQSVGDMIVKFYYHNPTDQSKVLALKYDKLSEMPSLIALPIGFYTVVMHSPSGSKHYFLGSKEIEVKQDGKIDPMVECFMVAVEVGNPDFSDTYGGMSIEIETKYSLANGVTPEFEIPLPEDLMVELFYKKNDGVTILGKVYEPKEIIPSIVGVPTGNWNVKASSATKMEDVSDSPYFSGENNVEVVFDHANMAKCKVVSTMKNAYFSLKVTDDFNLAFENWKAELQFIYQDQPSYEFGPQTQNYKFVRASNFGVKLTAVERNSGKEYVEYKMFSGDLEGASVEMILNANASGQAGVVLEIDATILRQDHTIYFPDDDNELGGGGNKPNPNPDPDPEPEIEKPTIVGEGFDIDQVKRIAKTEDFDQDGNLKVPIKVTTKAANGGFQKFEIEINSPSLGPELLVPLFGGNKFDLTNVPAGSALETNLDVLGILPLGTKVKDQVSFVFDLTPFMSLLPVHADSHNFTLRIQDANGDKQEKTVRILIVE